MLHSLTDFSENISIKLIPRQPFVKFHVTSVTGHASCSFSLSEWSLCY